MSKDAGSGRRRCRRLIEARDRRACRGQEEPRLRHRRPHPRGAEGRRNRVGGFGFRHHMAPGMNAPLYTTEILRLAASLPEPRKLDRVDGRRRAALADLRKHGPARRSAGEDGPSRSGFAAGACLRLRPGVRQPSRGERRRAFERRGRSRRRRSAAWLSGGRDDPGSWPGLSALVARAVAQSRHGAILLPFKALAAAMQGARG